MTFRSQGGRLRVRGVVGLRESGERVDSVGKKGKTFEILR